MPSGVYVRTKEHRLKLTKYKSFLGKKHTLETRQRISASRKGKASGDKNYQWINDRTKLKKYSGSNERRSPIYKAWSREVRNRDSWKCRLKSSDCSGRLEVHHIFGWTAYPELRYLLNNGITLCHFHHPRVREEEKRLIPIFQELVSVSKE